MSFGMAELTHAAGAVSAALSEMSGATSPKLQLELMCAKVLVPSSDKTEVGSLARIERLERRMGFAEDSESKPSKSPAAKSTPITSAAKETAAEPAPVAVKTGAPKTISAVTKQAMVNAWPEILGQVKTESRSAWVVAFTLTVMDLTDDVLTLKFLSQKDLDSFKADSRSTDALRKAIFSVLGIQVKFRPHVDESAEVGASDPVTTEMPVVSETTTKQTVDPTRDQSSKEPSTADVAPESAPSTSRNSMVDEEARYGESLLREVLGAEPIQDPKSGGR
jgi:DNA polymerase-3 subunit gamma/tau